MRTALFRTLGLSLAALIPCAGVIVACADRGALPSARTNTPNASARPATEVDAGDGHAPKTAAKMAQAQRGPHAPFVVAFVVDQLSAWVAEERWPLLPENGGFARLRREGTWVKRMRLPYSVTDTAPGHASLHTGKVPAESGIWGNELPDPSTGGRVTFLRDPAMKVITPEGILEAQGASPARLHVDNVADRLRAAHPDAFIVSVSLKDRGAIMPGGHKPSHALWFESAFGTFTSSTAFTNRFPAWAAPIADARAVERARNVPWTLSDPDWIKRNSPQIKDDADGEGDLDGFGITFPHVAGKSNQAFRASPASDKMILDIALAAIAAEYDSAKPTLLTLSMSACDVVGHVFGPDSWEAWDHLYKLDASIGRFLDELDARVGGDISVVLSADHGNSSMPEVVKARRPQSCEAAAVRPRDPVYDRPICTKGSRLESSELQAELKAEAQKTLGPGEWFLGIADPYVFLGKLGREADPKTRAKIDDVVKRVLDRHKPFLQEVLDVRVLETKCPAVLGKARGIPARAQAGEDILTLVCRSWAPNVGAGDWYMVPAHGSFFDGEIVPGKGGSHGGPYLHDRTVPLLARAKGMLDANVVIDDPVDFTAYSELVLSLLGVNANANASKKSPNEIIETLRASAKR